MRGADVAVTSVGEAEGSRALAAALACAASDPGRAALLVELCDGRPPRPALIASAAARGLEERLAAHLPGVSVASRGAICHLALPADSESLALVRAALALVRDSLGALCLPPCLIQPALDDLRLGVGAVLLRADLGRDRALTALAARDLVARGLRVAVVRQPLPWIQSRRALFGALPSGSAGGLAPRVLRQVGAAPPGQVPA